MPKFTVLTPTYNRAEFLPKVFESLSRQTCTEFEWIVVDDGSQDDTATVMHKLMAKPAPFLIKYIPKTNGGKHTAWNCGVDAANSELFVCLDSDDSLVAEALETLWKHWEDIPAASRLQYAGVTALSRFPDEKIIGTRFPADVFDSTHIELIEKHGMWGDKMSCFRTDLLKEFKFPVWPDERFATEALIFNRIEREHKTRFVNDILQIKEYLPGGLTDKSVLLRIKSPQATCTFYSELVSYSSPGWPRLRAAINFMRFAFQAKRRSIWRLALNFPGWYALALIPGLAAAIKDRLILRKTLG